MSFVCEEAVGDGEAAEREDHQVDDVDCFAHCV